MVWLLSAYVSVFPCGALGNVNVLNRLAEKNTLPPFYDGKVSQDRPYRREVANGVLQYVEKIVENRS